VCYITQCCKGLRGKMRSSILGAFISYEENEVFWIWFQTLKPVCWTNADAKLQLKVLPNSYLSEVWFWSHFVVVLKLGLDVQQTQLWGLYYKNITIVNDTSRVIIVTIVSDALSCGITYTHHSDKSRGVIYNPREHLWHRLHSWWLSFVIVIFL
jgi:hypothetical protein